MRYLLLILTIILTSDSHGQQKIVFKKGLKREVIKIDRTIGVTLKGQSFKYAKWESICHGSEDCLLQNSLYRLDSIKKDYIVVSQVINYHCENDVDTISYIEQNINRKGVTQQKINIDAISSISFSDHENCTGFGISVPLACLMFIAGAPIAAFADGKFNPGILIIGEIIGIGMTYLVYKHVIGLKVRTFDLADWTIKIKSK